jgi:hypothetical protein
VAQFGGPIVAWVVSLLSAPTTAAALTAAQLTPFGDVRESWTGVIVNWPEAAVMLRNIAFDPEIEGARQEAMSLTVKFGVNGADPDQVVSDAMGYMAAIDAAINGAAWLPQMSRVFVAAHDFGPLFSKDGSFAKFPEMHLVVEVFEGL